MKILDHEVKDRGGAGRAISVKVRNDSNRTLSTTRLTLYNGRPNDDIIISDGLLGGIEPNRTGDVELNFDLDAGLYYLTLVVSSSEVDNVSIPWNDRMLDSKGFQLEIVETQEDDGSRNDVDMGEVTDGLMIGGASIATVILVSFLFKKRDEEENEEKK